jgi:hypothetical protein
MLELLSFVVLSAFIIALARVEWVLFRILGGDGFVGVTGYKQRLAISAVRHSFFPQQSTTPSRRATSSSYWLIYIYKRIPFHPNNVFIRLHAPTP